LFTFLIDDGFSKETRAMIVNMWIKIIPVKSLRVLFPAPWGEKMINKVPVEYPAFERNEKVER
jgi:hypothetical protein